MNEWTMTQSATGLDISDDESKSFYKKSSSLDRGKENVDPNDTDAPMTRSMAAAAAFAQAREKEIKMDEKEEARSPLGDLNPTKFYAEGLDVTSVVLVHDDEEAETDVEGEDTKDHDFTFQPPTTTKATLSPTSKVIKDLNTPSLAEILSAPTPNFFQNPAIEDEAEAAGHPLTMADDHMAFADADGDVEIDIWESESAKNENEKPDLPGSPRSVVGDENMFALQEL